MSDRPPVDAQFRVRPPGQKVDAPVIKIGVPSWLKRWFGKEKPLTKEPTESPDERIRRTQDTLDAQRARMDDMIKGRKAFEDAQRKKKITDELQQLRRSPGEI